MTEELIIQEQPKIDKEKRYQVLLAAQEVARGKVSRDDLVTAMRDTTRKWDDNDVSYLDSVLPEIQQNEDYKQKILESAYTSVLEEEEDPTIASDIVNLMEKRENWGEKEQRVFYGAREYFKKQLREQLEAGDISKEYAKRLEKKIPIVRDIALGIDLGRRGLYSLATRPFSYEKATKIIEGSEIMEKGAMLADESSPLGQMGKHVRGASRSIFQAATLSPLGGWGIIGGFALSRGNQAITEADKAGLSGGEKWEYIAKSAAIEGSIAGAFQLVGLGGFEKFAAGGITATGLKSFFKQAGIQMAAELVEENITEILDQLNQMSMLPEYQNLTDEEKDKMFYDTFRDTTIQTVITMGVTTGYRGVTINQNKKSLAKLKNTLVNDYKISSEQAQKAIDTALKKQEGKDTFEKALGREIYNEKMKTKEGASLWATNNTDQAIELANIEKPSQTEFEKFKNTPEIKIEDRAEFVKNVRSFLDNTGVEWQRVTEAPQEVVTEPVTEEAAEKVPEVVEEIEAVKKPEIEGVEEVQQIEKAKAHVRATEPDVIRTAEDQDPVSGKPISIEMFRGEGRETKEQAYAEGVEGAIWEGGQFWAMSEKSAKTYGPEVTKKTLDLNNPYVVTNTDSITDITGKALPIDNESRKAVLSDFVSKIKEMGHDSILINIPQFSDMDAKGESAKKIREIFGETQIFMFEPEIEAITEEQVKVEKPVVESLMDTPVSIAQEKTIEGVAYQLYREKDGKAGFIQTVDVDTGKTIQVRKYTDFNDAMEAHQETMDAAEPKAEKPVEKKVVQPELFAGPLFEQKVEKPKIGKVKVPKKAKKLGSFDKAELKSNTLTGRILIDEGQFNAKALRDVGQDPEAISESMFRPTQAFGRQMKVVVDEGGIGDIDLWAQEFHDSLVNEGVIGKMETEEGKVDTESFLEWVFDTLAEEKISLDAGKMPKTLAEPSERAEVEFEKLTKAELGFAGKAKIPTETKGVAPRPIGTEEVVRNMAQAFDVPIRTGRYRGKLKGIYKKLPKVIRTKKYADIAVTSHEIAHSISDKSGIIKTIPADIKSELRSLDYDPKQLRLEEGFAEYIRYYLTTDEASERAPKFHAWFEKWLTKSEYATPIADTKEMITNWRTQGSVARVAGQISSYDKKGRNRDAGALYVERGPLSKTWHGFLNLFTNRMHPLWDAEYAMAKTLNLKQLPYDESFAAAAKVLTMVSSARANAAVNDYMPNVKGERVGKSIKEILNPIANDINEPGGMLAFESFLYSRHAIDAIKQNKDPGISLEDANEVIVRYGDRPGWEDAANGVTEWHDQLLDYLIDAGGLTAKAKEIMRKMYPHYVPLQREIKGARLDSAGRSFANLPSPLKRFKGSGRMVVSPLESSVQYAERIFSLADKIRVGRMLVDASEKYGGMGKFVEKVSPKSLKKDIKLANIAKQLEDAGIDMSEGDTDAVITMFENVYSGDPKDNIIVLWRDGKRELYQVDPEIYNAVIGLDKQFQLPKVIDWVLGKPARLVRLGAVGIKMSFGWVTNPLRDVQTAAQQTERKGFKGTLPSIMIDSVAGIMDDITGGDVSRLFKAGGGELAQPLGIDRQFVRNAIKKAIANTPSRKVALWVKDPIESLRSIISIPELGPRIAEFKAALQEKGWKQGDEITFGQYVEAQLRAANVTVDFREGGSLAMWLNRTNAFFNANIQGPHRMVQAIRKHPLSWTVKALSNITLPTILMWFAYKDEDWYKDLPAWEKFSYWHVKVGDEILRIPTPFEWFSVFGAVPLGALESAYRKDPKYVSEALKQVLKTATPDWLPTAAKPIIETTVNYDMFRDKPIVSPWMVDHLRPEDQYYGYTTELAKKVGEVFGVSPAKFEHLLSAYTGGMAKDIVKGTESTLRTIGVLPVKGAIPPEMSDIPVFGRLFLKPSANRVFNDFYTKLKELNQEYGSANLYGEKLSKDQFVQRSAMLKVSKILADHRKETKEVINDTDINTKEKRSKILEIRSKMLNEARNALEKPEEAFMKHKLGSSIYELTDPSGSDKEAMLKEVLKDMSYEELEKALRKEYKSQNKPNIKKASNDKWKIGSGYAIYETKEAAEEARSKQTRKLWKLTKPKIGKARATAFGRRIEKMEKLLNIKKPEK